MARHIQETGDDAEDTALTALVLAVLSFVCICHGSLQAVLMGL
jgi:hypothetical protein